MLKETKMKENEMVDGKAMAGLQGHGNDFFGS